MCCRAIATALLSTNIVFHFREFLSQDDDHQPLCRPWLFMLWSFFLSQGTTPHSDGDVYFYFSQGLNFFHPIRDTSTYSIMAKEVYIIVLAWLLTWLAAFDHEQQHQQQQQRYSVPQVCWATLKKHAWEFLKDLKAISVVASRDVLGGSDTIMVYKRPHREVISRGTNHESTAAARPFCWITK